MADDRFNGPKQRKFITNMAVGGALGASSGNAIASIATRGRARYRPLRSAEIGGAAGALTGAGMVSHQRRKKVKKNMTLSAFGVDHGDEVSKKGPLAASITIKSGKLAPAVGRGLPGKRAKAMAPLTAGSAAAGKHRLGGGTHSMGLMAKSLKLPHRIAMSKIPSMGSDAKGSYVRNRLGARYQSANRSIPGHDFKGLGEAHKDLANQAVHEYSASRKNLRRLP